MAGVERGQQIERLRAPDLADHDPVRAHPQGVAEQVADRDLAASLDPGRAALQPHHVRLPQAQLGGVLDRHHPLAGIDEARERVEQRRLAGTGATADEDAAAPADRRLQRLPLRHGQGAERDQLVGPGPAGAEAPDRDQRPVDRQRRDHDVDPRAVGEAGVDHRAELVHPAAQRRQDALDRVAQLLLVGEGDGGRLDAPAALHIDGAGTVDHHLLDGGIGEQDLERAEADAVADDPRRDLLAVAGREQDRLLVDQVSDRLSAGRRLPRHRWRPRPAGARPGAPAGLADSSATSRSRAATAQPLASRVTRRAKLSAAIRRRAWPRVRPSVAAAMPSPSAPSAPGPSASNGTAAAAT